jgi:macrolide transport system ATP-binding/permease protein
MRWLKQLFSRKRRFDELSEEIRRHVEERIAELIAGGMAPKDAAGFAHREFGNVTLVERDSREEWRFALIEDLVMDVRFGLRMLCKSPGFALVAVLTLALGIGINTVIFSAFDALVLRPRAVSDPERLALVFRTTPGENHGGLSYPDYIYYRDHGSSFSDLGLFAFGMAVTSSDFPVTGTETGTRAAKAIGFQLPQLLQGSAQPIGCFFVSGNYFPMLGTLPLKGRIIEPRDDEPNAAPVVMLSGNFWQKQYHSDPNVVGSVLHLNGIPFTVIGVTPVDYVGTLPDVPSLWAPVTARVQLGSISLEDLQSRRLIVGQPVGRLKTGVALSDAGAELGVLANQLKSLHPEDKRSEGVAVIPGRNNLALLEPWDWAVIAAVMTAVGLLLLIACANVASLLLARAAARHKEIAVRLALGAGRWRLLRQLLTESMLIGLLAGAVGLPLASWMLHLLIVEIGAALPSFWGTIALQVTPDIRIFAFTLLVSIVAGVAFGLAPALQATKAEVNSALKEEGSVFGQRMSRSRLRGLLIASQMAACLVLLINSALLLRGSQRALKIDTGYETKLTAYLEMYNPTNLHYAKPRLLQMNRDLVQGIARVPGVRSVAQASRGPISGIRWVSIAPADEPSPVEGNHGASEPVGAGYSYVTPNYFETLGIPLIRGRGFTQSESSAEAPVVVISDATAKRLWPGQDPIGKRIRIGLEKGEMSYPSDDDPRLACSQVIGIARDVHSLDLRKIDESYVYLPLSRDRRWTSTMLVRTEHDPAGVLGAIGSEVRRVEADLPVIAAAMNTMVSLDPHFVISRIGGVLASIVGSLGLVLACMGVYGMVSFSVTQRTREIGIRMALGADKEDVLRLAVGDGLRPILVGMLIGIVVSAGISHLLDAILFGLNPVDAISFAGVSLLLGAIGIIAAYIPARKAIRVDPMVALRHD